MDRANYLTRIEPCGLTGKLRGLLRVEEAVSCARGSVLFFLIEYEELASLRRGQPCQGAVRDCFPVSALGSIRVRQF